MQALNTANLSPTDTGRARLIERLDRKNPLDSIPRRHETGPASLSFSQERLWIMAQLEPDNPIYNVAGAARFDGALRVEILEQALAEVVRRHEILRSRFVTVDAEPRQQVLPEAELAWERLDLSALPGHEKMPAFERHADAFIRRPFRLAEQPPLRTMLAVMAPQRHILLLAFHHMACDRWSVGVLMREVAALYGAFCSGAPSPLTELPLQYADYCVWQSSRQAKWDSQLAYWQSKLAGAPPLLELPADRPRPPQQSYRGDAHCFELSAGLSLALKQLAKRHNATLFMVMAAAFSTLLYRYSGSRDFCIGYPVAGRGRSQLADLIGFFVNTLVLRCRIDGKMCFSAWLAQIRDQALQDQNHQELAFGQLLKALNPPRNSSHAPVFQVMLAVQNVPTVEFRIADLSVDPLTINNGVSQFDLTLFVDELDSCLRCTFEYSPDLFDASTIERMASHLQALLTHMAYAPTVPLEQLEILPAEQRRQLAETFNATDRHDLGRQQPQLIHALFEAQARKTPEAIALRFGSLSLSYAELNAKANRLAHALIGQGVGPDVLVGICLERSPDMVISLLGVLKAGGAYVPVDPEYPTERLQFMLADCAPAVLIGERRLLAAVLPAMADAEMRTVWLDEAETITCIAAQPESDPDPALLGLTPGHLAYAVYTSGSTGLPKGAMNQHAAVVNRLLWAQDEYRLSAADKVMQKTPFSFDVSVWEFFLPLLAGAELVVARPKGHQDPEYLQDLIASAGITILHFVPSMLQALLARLDAAKCRTLRQVLCSGEALPPTLQAGFYEALPDVALHNLYGPTEAAIDVTAWPCRPGDTTVPIGRPIANTRIYLLDESFLPVPIGIAGEIHIGGIAVGRGYLHRPALTAERFVPDPFSAGGRLYRTGDLGRWRADGSIEYLGRNDFQVKIRGFRIELGEIESRLCACAGVNEAVVVARGEPDGDKRLVAYLTCGPGIELSPAELRSRLAAALPDYMLPSAFVILPVFPLNANGKLDRAALPVPDAEALLRRQYQAPEGEVEKIMADIWRDLLDLESVGRHDHFFELGGHSLMALSLAERLRQKGWLLEARAVFAHPVLSGLAAMVSARQDSHPLGEIPPNLIPDYFGQSLSKSAIEEFVL
jgi:amino acid adenylation domain-containing protein